MRQGGLGRSLGSRQDLTCLYLLTETDDAMNCPVCGAEGADDQPVGPTVTVFCCPACVATVLRTFARHAARPAQPAPAGTPASWSASPA